MGIESPSPARRVVVTGYGCITSLGENSDEVWASIRNYRVGYRAVQFDSEFIKVRFFSFIEEKADRFRGFPKPVLRALPMFAKFALVAAREAVNMAFGSPEEIVNCYDPFECGVILMRY